MVDCSIKREEKADSVLISQCHMQREGHRLDNSSKLCVNVIFKTWLTDKWDRDWIQRLSNIIQAGRPEDAGAGHGARQEAADSALPQVPFHFDLSSS